MSDNCKRCNHSECTDRGCDAETAKGRPCNCPGLVPSVSGLASLSRFLKQELHRQGKTVPTEVEAQDGRPRRR